MQQSGSRDEHGVLERMKGSRCGWHTVSEEHPVIREICRKQIFEAVLGHVIDFSVYCKTND